MIHWREYASTPNKQTKGNSGKETKLHRQKWRTNLWRNQAQMHIVFVPSKLNLIESHYCKKRISTLKTWEPAIAELNTANYFQTKPHLMACFHWAVWFGTVWYAFMFNSIFRSTKIVNNTLLHFWNPFCTITTIQQQNNEPVSPSQKKAHILWEECLTTYCV